MKAYPALFWILGAWVCLVQTGPRGLPASASSSPTAARESLRQRAVELLEDLVQRERFFHRRTGVYTPMLARLEFEVPAELRPYLQIQVIEAARDRLLVRAYADPGLAEEGDALTQPDQIWANESFQMQANFALTGRTPATVSADPPLPELLIEQIEESASLKPSAKLPSR